MSCEPAGFEVLVEILLADADYDDGLRRRIAIAAIPEGVYSADGARQAVFRAVEIDGSGLAVICADDAQMSPLLRSERVANFRHFLHQFGPANFFAEISLHIVGDFPPASVEGRDWHPKRNGLEYLEHEHSPNDPAYGHGPGSLHRRQPLLAPHRACGIQH